MLVKAGPGALWPKRGMSFKRTYKKLEIVFITVLGAGIDSENYADKLVSSFHAIVNGSLSVPRKGSR